MEWYGWSVSMVSMEGMVGMLLGDTNTIMDFATYTLMGVTQ